MKIANVALGNVGCKPDWLKLCCWLKGRCPDIVTLQKIGQGQPSREHENELRKIGYEGRFRYHNRNYLGVAILIHRSFLKRRGLSPSEVLYPELPDADINEPRFPNESRFLTVSIGNLWVSSVYAPYGPERLGERGAIERRIAWLNRLRDNIRVAGNQHWLLCGDFNIKADGPPWGKYYSQDEEDALEELKNLGFCDLYRTMYRNSREKRGHTLGYSKECPNGTSRLHLILANKRLAQRLRSAYVDIESESRPRKDAPPLVLDLDDT